MCYLVWCEKSIRDNFLSQLCESSPLTRKGYRIVEGQSNASVADEFSAPYELSDRRNGAEAHTCFTQAIDARAGTPTRVTTDKAKSYPKAVHALLPDVEHRSSK
jgi:hypothetical protein